MIIKRAHYVDNKLFYEAFKKYLPIIRSERKKHKLLCKELLSKGTLEENLPSFKRPQTPEYEYIGECLLKIAEHLSHSPKFFPNYYNVFIKEEMVGDALENCIQYLENFDPKKSKNPFAYFTQVAWYAFYRRITKEAKHAYIKQKSLESAIDFFSTQGGDDGVYANTYIKFMRDLKNDVIVDFEARKNVKKKLIPKKSNPGIEKFMVVV